MAGPTLDRTDRPDRYQSLSSFFRRDPRRIGSPERDLGRWWRIGTHGPVYRAAWLNQTGELYVTRLDLPQDGAGEVELLGRADDRDQLERVLRGWTDVCHQPDSMTWLRHRAASLEKPATARIRSRKLPRIAVSGRSIQHAKAAFAQINGHTHSSYPLPGQP
jgi:hypothetical protein